MVLRYAGTPIATRVSFFFPFVYFEMPLFPNMFCTIAVSLCTESTPYVISFRMVFSYLVTTGWIFYISLLCENSINKKKSQEIPYGTNLVRPSFSTLTIGTTHWYSVVCCLKFGVVINFFSDQRGRRRHNRVVTLN